MKARVIFDNCREGSLNMALDYVMLQHLQEEEQVILRFYTWCPPTVSVGLFQEWHHDVSYPVVRRPTGGKAVLHDGDLSYALVAPLNGFGNSVLETYYLVSEGLIDGLGLLGVSADFLQAPLPAKDDPDGCFIHESGHEIGIWGRKVIGSAQARKPWGFLQHGSILVEPIYEHMSNLFGVSEEEVREHCIALKDLLPDITPGVLANALKEGLEHVLDVHFNVSEVTTEELRQASTISTKYTLCS
ncbi:lipoate--protein ligase family protein [Coprothermobacter platensis]|uniref:lipoate--protein ligase family protein n=1 Tax=Coprothermobacter platensis TaxID=108819 RepID=UPI00035E680C|nr:biotin/lipoate A/B protein ligase family protein [Coprothermobacter platensis]